MKSVNFIKILYILISIILVSCSDDDAPPPPTQPPEPEPVTVVTIETFAGYGVTECSANVLCDDTKSGYLNGTLAIARFYNPEGIVMDSEHNFYVADTGNNVIRKIDINNDVTTLAGCSENICSNGVGSEGYINGTLLDARFKNPIGLTIDNENNIYVADTGNNVIRKINITANKVTTIAGDGASDLNDNGGCTTNCPIDGSFANYKNGTLAVSRFNNPVRVTVNKTGDIFYVSDFYNSAIRKINRKLNNVSTVAGAEPDCVSLPIVCIGTVGYVNGNTEVSRLGYPQAITLDASGSVYFSDNISNEIRKLVTVSETNMVASTIAGTGTGCIDDCINSPNNAGYINGDFTKAKFNNIIDIEIDTDDTIYIVDNGNAAIRKLDIKSEKVSTYVGFWCDDGEICSPQNNYINGQVKKENGAKLTGPHGIVKNSLDKEFYFTDNNVIRKTIHTIE